MRASMTMPPGRRGVQWLLLAALCALPWCGARAEPPLALEAVIPLPDTAGRIDHLAIDPGGGRLFVAELGNGTVDVVDLAALRVVGRLRGLDAPQGIGYAPAADIIAVANAGDGSVRLFRGADLSPAATVQLGAEADNVRVDRSGRFVVGYGEGGLPVIDPKSGAVVQRSVLPGHPEGFQIDPVGRAVVNVPDVRQIAVLELATGQPVARWTVPGLSANFPLALSEDGTMAVAVFRRPPRLVLLRAADGTVAQRTDVCADADDVFLDPRRRRIYVSCGAGSVAVLQDGDRGYRTVQTVPTALGARTSLFVPERDRLFVARPAALLGGGAAILVLRPQDGRAD